MNKHKFSTSAPAIAIVTALVTVSPTAVAQDDEMIEEIVVTGIRGSLTNAMDIKRNADGVVDAISAEDIGKFPDANLAESLQRITGVSIDRAGNEGNLPNRKVSRLQHRAVRSTSIRSPLNLCLE